MACFLAPLTTAIVATAFKKRVPQKYHFSWFLWMLWGGTLMLIVEHIVHQEIVLYPPFLTRGLPEILPEVIKIGLPMTVLVFLVWTIIASFSLMKERKKILTSG
ncbi:MAG: hypothetical protein N2Z79_00955 [Candidatus Omnitrophica bacterium]|nr:hypothetical protein [Candidatus Omnitrophota bacterium]